MTYLTNRDMLGGVESTMRWYVIGLAIMLLASCAKPPPASRPLVDYRPVDLSTFQFRFDPDHGTIADIPQYIRDLDGQTVAVEGLMIPLDSADAITQFALVAAYSPPLQMIMVCTMPPGSALQYFPDRMRVLGTMHVAVTKDSEDVIVSLYTLNVQEAQSAATYRRLPTTRPAPAG